MKALTIPTVLIFAASAFAQNPPPPPAQQTGSGSAPGRIAPGTTNPAGTPAAPAVSNVPEDTVVLTIGTVKITRAEFEKWVSALPEQYQAAARGPQKRKFVEQYAEIEALAQAARERKLDQKPDVKMMISLQSDQVLASSLAQDVAANVKPDDAAAKAYYEAHKGEFEEAKARHILIRFKGSQVPLKTGEKDLTEEEALAKAKEIREKIVKGGDFANFAKAESDDAGSGANGGELGSFGHNRMVKPFEEAAFNLPIGEVSQPVKSPFGYHIIQVESRTAKPYEEVKAQMEAKVKSDMAKKAIDMVKAGIPVVVNDEYFGK